MNHNSRSESYAAAGVDITAGYRAVELMKSHIARTMTAGVCSDIGGFGGLFELDTTGIEHPVLVSGTDGVGTKLKLAFLMDKQLRNSSLTPAGAGSPATCFMSRPPAPTSPFKRL